MQAFIDDGYTQRVGIKERPGVYPTTEFTIRPMAGNEVRAAFQKIATAGEPALYELVCDRVSDWNLGREISAASLARMQPALFERIWGILTGERAADYVVTESGQSPPANPGDDGKN